MWACLANFVSIYLSQQRGSHDHDLYFELGGRIRPGKGRALTKLTTETKLARTVSVVLFVFLREGFPGCGLVL